MGARSGSCLGPSDITGRDHRFAVGFSVSQPTKEIAIPHPLQDCQTAAGAAPQVVKLCKIIATFASDADFSEIRFGATCGAGPLCTVADINRGENATFAGYAAGGSRTKPRQCVRAGRLRGFDVRPEPFDEFLNMLSPPNCHVEDAVDEIKPPCGVNFHPSLARSREPTLNVV
jgi:hypothetical protein